ncbi:MAG: hypothetical protein IE890_12840 [Arcobacter sp.]|nr:hypothetical protein [Arcobacter sp.]
MYLISESRYRNFVIADRKHKFDEKKPLKETIEQINRFENLLARAYSEDLISASKLAELSGKNINDVLKKYGDIF